MRPVPQQKPSSVIMLDIIIDMYEWSDGCMGFKYVDEYNRRCIRVNEYDFQILIQYMGKYRTKLVNYRSYVITASPLLPNNPIMRFFRG